MGWQEDEATRRYAEEALQRDNGAVIEKRRKREIQEVLSFWQSLLATNKRLPGSIRASSSNQCKTLRGLKNWIHYVEYPDMIGITNEDTSGRSVCIKYSHEKNCLYANGNQITRKDIDTILKNLCTGRHFLEGLV